MTVHHCPHEWHRYSAGEHSYGWTCKACGEHVDAAEFPDTRERPDSPAIVQRANLGTRFLVIDPSTYPHGHTTFDEAEPTHEHWARFGSGQTVIDIGACFGSYTLPALARGARVIAFEPSDDGYRITRENVEANGWSNRFELWRFTLWNGTPYPSALFDDVFGRSYPAAKVDAQFTTLDDLLGPRVQQQIHAIKIDVEGAELGVLQGSVETLKNHRPMVLIEDHDGIAPGLPVSDYPASIESSRHIHTLLHDLGYETRALTYERGRKYIVAEVK